MDQNTADRIQSLEERVNWLTTLVIVLAIAVTPLAGLIPLAIIGFLLLLPVLAFTHQWLPRIANRCGKLASIVLRPFVH